MKLNPIIFSICTSIFGTEALAQQAHQNISMTEAAGLTTHVEIVINDEVDNGCWTNSGQIKSALRLLFEQNGIPVFETDGIAINSVINPTINIYGLGARASGGGHCFGMAEFSNEFWSHSRIGSQEIHGKQFSVAVNSNTFKQTSTFSSGSNFNEQFKEFFIAAASEFIADIHAGKRAENVQKLRNTLPKSFEKPLTVREFRELIEAVEKQN